MGPTEGRDVWQELGDHGQAGMSSPSDRFAQPGGVPVDDDGGKQVEACHAVVLAFRAAIPDFSLTADAQGVLQGVVGFSLVEALLHDSTAARVGALFQLFVQDTTAQDFGLPSSAIRLRM